MNRFGNYLLALAFTASMVATATVVPYISIRSQSENANRELVLWQTQINLYDMDRINGSFSITPGYCRTFQPEKLAKFLFCDSLDNDNCETKCSTFKIQGSLVGNGAAGRDPKAWLADYFGLPLDYSSVVAVEPRMDEFLVDFNFYLGLDEWLEGFYFRIHAPIVHTRWDLNFCESINNQGTANLPLGYFNNINVAPTSVPQQYYGDTRNNLVQSFEGFISRGEIPNINNVTFQPLKKAKMARCHRDETKLSDVQMALGWNFWIDEDYHVGLNLRAAAPTGNRPEGDWLFEPIVGNGKHWELGAGLTSHWALWRSEDERDNLALYLDANVTHLFKARQCRSFDICGKPLSRYMLAEKMNTTATHLQNSDGTLKPSYQFAGEFAPVANLSTIPVDVSAAIQGDLVLKLAYTHHNFQFDIGYDFWGRSCEEIFPRCDCSNNENGNWALKGDAFVYGFTFFAGALQPGIPLSATEHDATIFCGTNNAQRDGSPYWTQNPGVDNANFAYSDIGPTQLTNNRFGAIPVNQFDPIYSSFDSSGVFSTSETKQWDIKSGETRGISNKIFFNLGYIWTEHCDWIPYLGVGAETEFAAHNKACCCNVDTTCQTKTPADPLPTTLIAGTDFNCCVNNNCSSNNKACGSKKCDSSNCPTVAISQWGVWVKGGISFN